MKTERYGYFLGFFLVIILVSGCSYFDFDDAVADSRAVETEGQHNQTQAEISYVTTKRTPFYAHPAQASPPNGFLDADTKVQFVRSAGSYFLVKTTSGKDWYVISSALKLLKSFNKTKWKKYEI